MSRTRRRIETPPGDPDDGTVTEAALSLPPVHSQTGASCGPEQAPECLHRFCAQLPCDAYTRSTGQQTLQLKELIDVEAALPADFPESMPPLTSSSVPVKEQYVAVLKLPPQCPLRDEIRSLPMEKKEDARRSAMLRTVEWLLENGLLDDNFEPASRGQPAEPLVEALAAGRRTPPSFEELHPKLDISASKGKDTNKWPEKMRLLQIQVQMVCDADSRYGLLVNPADDAALLGLAIEFGRRTRGVARFVPYEIEWPPRSLIELESGLNPAALVQKYHESMMHTLLPWVKSRVNALEAPLPTTALLVRLLPSPAALAPSNGAVVAFGDPPEFAWQEMQAQVKDAVRLEKIDSMERSIELQIQKATRQCGMAANPSGDDEDDEQQPGTCSDSGSEGGPASSDEAKASKNPPDLFCSDGDSSDGDSQNASEPEEPDASPMEPDEEPIGDVGLPFWLPALLQRWFRLHDFEALAGPVYPTLSPIILESALTMPSAQLTRQPCNALMLIGAAVLQSMTTFDNYVKYPSEHAAQLEQKQNWRQHRNDLTMLMKQPRQGFADTTRMVETEPYRLRKWLPPGVRCKQAIADDGKTPALDVEDCARTMEAHFGAYFLAEAGGFSSAWNYRQWLKRTAHPERSASLVEEEHPILGHYLFGGHRGFSGRTPSYTELQEIEFHDPVKKKLRVHFEERGWVEYRRPVPGMIDRRDPEERMADTPCEWKSLSWSLTHGTFVSAYMMDGETHYPLPNKVTFWIRGGPVASMATVKHFMGRTPEIVQLQERKDGKLRVKYRGTGAPGAQCSGDWYIYERTNDGGLGIEYREGDVPGSEGEGGRTAPKYSERFKTFKSALKDHPLPNKVVEWLRFKSLALLAVPRRNEGEEPDRMDEDARVEQQEDMWIKWCYEGRTFKCFGKRVPGGLIYLEEELGPDPKPAAEALLYSEELKTWLSPALTRDRASEETRGIRVPTQVIDWLKKYVQRMIKDHGATMSVFRKQWGSTPWCPVPAYIKSMIPAQLNLPLIEAQAFNYSFRNPNLLVEALTHTSFLRATTASCQRMAHLGAPFTKLLVTKQLIEKSEFPVKAERLVGGEDEDGGGRDLPETFTVTWLPGEPRKWPKRAKPGAHGWHGRGSENEGPADTPARVRDSQLQGWVSACCNNVAYANACVKLRLHEHILEDSPDLKQAIKGFAKLAKKLERDGDKETFWPTMQTKGAPRFLGDVFQAVVAAVLQDSDWNNAARIFNPIIKEHVIDIVVRKESMDGAGAPSPWVDPVSQVQREAEDLGLRIAFAKRAPEDICARNDDHQCAVHIQDANGSERVPLPLIEAPPATPRSAERRAACQAREQIKAALANVNRTFATNIGKDELKKELLKALAAGGGESAGNVDEGESDEGDSSSSVSSDHETTPSLPAEQRTDGTSVYCPDCLMRLNGPTQWHDHRIGKKHRKNVLRTRRHIGRALPNVQHTAGGSSPSTGEGDDSDGGNSPFDPIAPLSAHNEVSLLNEFVQKHFGTPVSGQKLLAWDFEDIKGRPEEDMGLPEGHKSGPLFRAILRVESAEYTCKGGWLASKKAAQRSCAAKALGELEPEGKFKDTPTGPVVGVKGKRDNHRVPAGFGLCATPASDKAGFGRDRAPARDGGDAAGSEGFPGGGRGQVAGPQDAVAGTASSAAAMGAPCGGWSAHPGWVEYCNHLYSYGSGYGHHTQYEFRSGWSMQSEWAGIHPEQEHPGYDQGYHHHQPGYPEHLGYHQGPC